MPDAADILARCGEGSLDPALALMQLFLAIPNETLARDALRKALSLAPADAQDRLAGMERLWSETPNAFTLVNKVAGAAAPDTRSIAEWAAIFDRAARASPEASVALYSLGRADLLAAATADLVRLLHDRALLQLSTHVLEIGCGIGRMAAALAPRVAHVTGVDISSVMIAEARKRVTDRNVSFAQGSGRDLSFVASGSVDLVLAVDVFPYLVVAGDDVLSANIGECARVLRDGGQVMLFNFSYRGDEQRDRSDVEDLSRAAGLEVIDVGKYLKTWDGLLFNLRKPDGQSES